MRNKNTQLNFIRFYYCKILFDLYILYIKVWECILFDPKKCVRAIIF